MGQRKNQLVNSFVSQQPLLISTIIIFYATKFTAGQLFDQQNFQNIYNQPQQQQQFGNNFQQQQQQQPFSRGQSSLNPSAFNTLTNSWPQSPADYNSQYPRLDNGRPPWDVDWRFRDRRNDEGWNHLYQFGEKYQDIDWTMGPKKEEVQIDLDFFLPFYGFRFNYTYIHRDGYIAFAYSPYIQPPYDFPNPKWPEERDPSFIAVFMTNTDMMHVGQYKMSHVWYRIITRPLSMIQPVHGLLNTQSFNTVPRFGLPGTRMYGNQILHSQPGRVDDPELLDIMTQDLRNGMVGARGFTADYALLVTWERVAYGGAPKYTDLNKFEEAKLGQNTYQLLVLTDEIRTYVIMNYARINWTASTSSGAFSGRGGRQSALVGFNGGNGTGLFRMPWSSDGDSYKLVQYGSAPVKGRWLARVDEQIEYGGCSNDTTGILQMDKQQATMLGGFSLNVSAACFRPTYTVKIYIEEIVIPCEILSMVVARCVVDVKKLYKTGAVKIGLSIDGGNIYPWTNIFYILMPSLARRQVKLENNPTVPQDNWRGFNPDNLTLKYDHHNISVYRNAQVDIALWGYWEDGAEHVLDEIGYIAKNTPNTGIYSFRPRTLNKADILYEAWKGMAGGLVQVRVTNNWRADRGDGVYWSELIPFGWFFHDVWFQKWGKNWALDMCIDWFAYDGRRDNFYMFLENSYSCPCTIHQAFADIGRFVALSHCDLHGDRSCPYTQGAQHCVISTTSTQSGAAQMCCYDWQGWLMFSHDYEYNPTFITHTSAGAPYRAHPWGSYNFKVPPRKPSLSNFYNDLLPYEICCKWAGHCEFYFWRRMTSGCQDYKPPALGHVFGQGHFITFDGTRYRFNGNGYFTLASMQHTKNSEMNVQIRMEQPSKNVWNEQVPATVVTGVAAQDNGSDVVQIMARKDFTRWRYKTDVYVRGVRIFFDTTWQKLQTFTGVTIRSTPNNMNMSELEVMFATGLGLKVKEAGGSLQVIVSAPPSYNESISYFTRNEYGYPVAPIGLTSGAGRCSSHKRTMGLLGPWNNDPMDDMTTPDCSTVNIGSYPQTASDMMTIYNSFGEKWRINPDKTKILFDVKLKPLYNPLSFNNASYGATFDPTRYDMNHYYSSLAFTPEEVEVACQGSAACKFDYMTTGKREIGLNTLDAERKFLGLKETGQKELISCGPLQKNDRVLKQPVGNTYLEGVTVTFSCQPDYFLHGEQQRTCVNGTWTPGWWAWCRWRDEEYALKWFTGIMVSVLIVATVTAIFCWCWSIRKRQQNAQRKRPYTNGRFIPPLKTAGDEHFAKQHSSVAVIEGEPQKLGNERIKKSPQQQIPQKMHSSSPPRFVETSA